MRVTAKEIILHSDQEKIQHIRSAMLEEIVASRTNLIEALLVSYLAGVKKLEGSGMEATAEYNHCKRHAEKLAARIEGIYTDSFDWDSIDIFLKKK